MAFEEVRRMLLFSILKRKIFLAHYLQQLQKYVYENNKIKIKLDTTLTQPIKIKEFNKAAHFHQLYFTNI